MRTHTMPARPAGIDLEAFNRHEQVILLGRRIDQLRKSITDYDAMHARRRSALVRELDGLQAEFSRASQLSAAELKR